MGNIGSSEILVVLLLALLVLGPTRLPSAARQVGKAMAEFRKVTSGLQTEMRDAMSEFDREVNEDDSPSFPPRQEPASADSGDSPSVVDAVPEAASAWVFPDMTPADPESALDEPVTETAAETGHVRSEHES